MESTCQYEIELAIESVPELAGIEVLPQLGLCPTANAKEKGSEVLPTLQSLW